MHDQKPPLIIYPSRVRTFFWAVMALAFVAAGLFVAAGSLGRRLDPLERFVVVYFGVPFFGLCFVHMALTMLRRKPSLVVTYEGMFHNQGMFPLGFVPWEEVKEVYPCVAAHRMRILRIELRDPEAIKARQGAITKLVRRTSGKKGAGRIDILDMGLPLSTEQIYSRMWEYMPESLKSM